MNNRNVDFAKIKPIPKRFKNGHHSLNGVAGLLYYTTGRKYQLELNFSDKNVAIFKFHLNINL